MKGVTHMCYINGSPYGRGDADYMVELFRDHVATCDMYGGDSVDFRVERTQPIPDLPPLLEMIQNAKKTPTDYR